MDDLHTHRLSGGILVATELHSAVVEWTSLATDGLVLQQLELHGLRYIQDLVSVIPEEDLLAILLTFAIVFSSESHISICRSKPLDHNVISVGTVKLCFYEMSTQSAHRIAREPVIQVSIPGEGIVNFELDICGSKIALLTSATRVFSYTIGRTVAFLWTFVANIQPSHLSPDVLLLPVVQGFAGTFGLWTT
ncbi:hypothetical protein C8F04DRAFT_116810 [Mycena alexandri]|uniref:Uncharacterized protein n=1 Tax=Mycena alexandri TaxID=1745969 RepID=A0AAD6TD38_9AGAR|nr:hypothetical protein C8F04DRAFT_116810 [Mycena alexandri]